MSDVERFHGSPSIASATPRERDRSLVLSGSALPGGLAEDGDGDAPVAAAREVQHLELPASPDLS